MAAFNNSRPFSRSVRTGIALAFYAGFLWSGVPTTQPVPEGAPKYTGPGSCAAVSCHGGVQPRYENSVLQNEYSTWAVKDKHIRAYAALLSPVGQRMGRILGIHSETAQKCLVCHTLDVPASDRSRSFDRNDGVSCESCHGPASNWLGPHTSKDWSHQKSVQAGMYDIRDPIKASEKCLSCHLGTSERVVDHEMIAAGHPDLYFELDSFEAVMPRHWKLATDKDPMIGIRTLATGEAVQLRDSLHRLVRDAESPKWPEYSELDCFACHHSLTAAKDSWRQERGYPERRPGDPPFNMSRYVVFERVATQMDADAAAQLRAQLRDVYKLATGHGAPPPELVSVANQAAAIADGLAHRFATANFDTASAARLIKDISANADVIAGQGERSAEQAAMAVDTLYIAYSRVNKPPNDEAIRSSINGLFAQFDNPSAYQPSRFAQQLRGVGAQIR